MEAFGFVGPALPQTVALAEVAENFVQNSLQVVVEPTHWDFSTGLG